MKTRRLISMLLCIAMLGSLLTVGAFAKNVPEWAIDDGSAPQAQLQAELPAKYDLRTEGRVSPVKFQNPWGSCWAFGGLAAAEISIMSDFGTTYEKSKLDLSERHLTYFALQPVTEAINPTQVGEGLYTFSEDPNAAFDAGGTSIYITTLFSQGTGPVREELFPYRGANATTTLQYFNEHAEEETMEQVGIAAESMGMTAEQFLQMRAEQKGITPEQMLAEFIEILREAYTNNLTYSKYDDWSIPEFNADGQANRLLNSGVVLKDGNILPAYWNADRTELNPEGLKAMKQELVNGHGVFLSYFADQSGTYTMSSDEGGSSYNQYIDQYMGLNHGVCVVGYDDSYAKENFKITPPGDGAWIIKNSWGSQADATVDDLGNPVNRGDHGIKNEKGEATGYFYLSYYDKTINQTETMAFTSNLAGGDGFYTLQYDYMPSQSGFFATSPDEEPQSAANMFASTKALEIKSVSTRTSETNMRVTFAIYALEDNAKDPTDGELLYRSSCNFEYAGFHRLDLDRPVTVAANKTFSIVTTASVLTEDGRRLYNVSANSGATKEMAEGKTKVYSKAVVNKEESMFYANGEWTDWKDYVEEYADGTPVDNFAIKAYCVDAKPASGYLPGDLNHDGYVNAKDVTFLRRALAGGYGIELS